MTDQMIGHRCDGQTHYDGCKCHEAAWLHRLNQERQDLLECRIANTALQASVALLKEKLEPLQSKLDRALSEFKTCALRSYWGLVGECDPCAQDTFKARLQTEKAKDKPE